MFLLDCRRGWGLELVAGSGAHLNVSFVLSNARDRVVYVPALRANIVFCFAESLWYLWGRDDLEMISYYAPRLTRYSADGKPCPVPPTGRSCWRPAGGRLPGVGHNRISPTKRWSGGLKLTV